MPVKKKITGKGMNISIPNPFRRYRTAPAPTIGTTAPLYTQPTSRLLESRGGVQTGINLLAAGPNSEAASSNAERRIAEGTAAIAAIDTALATRRMIPSVVKKVITKGEGAGKISKAKTELSKVEQSIKKLKKALK